MKFDIDSARKAGYSDDEIADYLATENKFDLSGAIESGYTARDVIDFLSKPKGGKQDLPSDVTPSTAGAGRGSVNPATVDTRGIIERVGDYLRPAPKSVMEGYVPTPEERQADVDRRLSYGAGPISSDTAAKADLVRSGMAKTDSPTVKKVAKAMDEQGATSFGDLVAAAKNPQNERAARESKADEFRSPGEWAVDTLSNLSQGAVGLVQLPVNIIAPDSSLAQTLRDTQKDLVAQESDVLRANRERLKERVLSEDGFLDRYVATVKELITNPTLSISEAAKQLPNFLGVVGAAKTAAGVFNAGMNVAERAAPTLALGEAISGGAVRAAGQAVATNVGGAAASMVMAGGDAAGDTYEQLTDRNQTPLSVWKQNPDYQKLVAEGKTSDEAIKEVATAKARMAALMTAPLGLLGYAGAEAAVASKGLGRATTEALTIRGAAKTAGKDWVGEQLEEGGTQFGSNVAKQTVDQRQSLTEGVPEAMGMAAVTSAPYSITGARAAYKDAIQTPPDQVVAGRIADVLIGQEQADPRLINPLDTIRGEEQVGPNAPARAAETTNFTPPDSPTAEAGLVPIVVPTAVSAPADETLTPVAAVNPETERAFGLDKLRMGGTNVGTTAGAGTAPAAGGIAGSDQRGGGLDLSGSGLAGARQLDAASARGAARDGGSDVAAGGAAGQPAADLTAKNNNAVVEPAEQWFGRKGDGYATEADATQALPGRQRMFPTLDWKIEQMPSGKFRLAGYDQNVQAQTEAGASTATGRGLSSAGAATPVEASGLTVQTQENTLGNQAPQALQTEAQGQEAAAGASSVAASRAAAAPAQLQDRGVPRLNLAPTASIRDFGTFQKAVAADGIEIAPVRVSEMNDTHKLASVVARLLGKTYTVARVTSGNPRMLSNGMIDKLGGKHIVAAENTEDAPLFVAMHEAYHGLPADKRKALNTQLLQIFRAENKERFLTEFNYTEAQFEEEAPAFMAQVITKRADFWEELRNKMGNKEFGEVAKIILDSLNTLLRKVSGQYGQDFADTYISDIVKARNLLTTAYAEAMQAQGQPVDTEVDSGVVASNKSDIGAALQERVDNDFDALVQEYNALRGTDGGRILDTDIARELSPEYKADRSRAAEIHEAASAFIQKLFDIRMAAPHNGEAVVMMAGGGGSGKSSAKDILGAEYASAGTVLDGTLSSLDKARRNIQRVLDSGRAVSVMYVYREPVEALRNGVLKRAMRGGRTVPIDALVKAHAGASDVMRQLAKDYAGSEDVAIRVIDNSRGPGAAVQSSLENITPVIKSGLKERFTNATEEEFNAGRISETVYRATVGDAGAAPQVARETAADDAGSRREAGQGRGPEGSGNPVSKDEAVVDGVVYSSKRRNLVDIPTIEFKDLVGKKVVGIKADLTDAGRSYTGIDGSQLEFPVEMMGGPNYVRLPENAKANVVWAVRGGATLTKILSQVSKADYVLVHAMNGNSHLTNSTISTAYLQTVEAYLRDGRISRENLLALDDIVRSPKNKSGLPDFPGFESPEIYSYIDGLSFDQRGALAQILEKKEAQAHGLPNLERFRRETIDPDFAGYRQGDAMLVIKVDKENPTVKLGEEGTKLHPSYPLGLRGTVIGKLSKGVNYEMIFRDYFKFAVPNFKNGEAGAWYAFDRKMPIQKITKEIAESVAPGAYNAIKTARQAEAALAMANGNWLVSGKTKAQGGISVQEFVDALRANDGAAALTLYTADEVKAGIKDKSFTIYQLGNQGGDKGLQVFFGLKRGAPWYKGMIDGVSDNEVEVVSVTNNEAGAPGIGIPAIITKAISEGATVLDAFAVKSDRFPGGFLPEMYAQFGFEEIGRIPFDASYYDATQMADLKAFWSKGGWNESDGFPDVVVMRWKGNDEDRATAVERYVRSGDTGVSAQAPRYTRAAAGEPDQLSDSPRRAKGRAGRGDAVATRGNQGAGDAASVVSRAFSSIRELATLGDGDIRNLGLDPAEVQRLRDGLAGVQRSNRPAELARGPGARPDAGDGSTFTGIHYGKAAGLRFLSGTSFGTGIKGAEQARLAEPGVDPRIKKRVYFYLTNNNTDMPRPEIGLGSHVYRATLGNLYDPSKASPEAAKRVKALMQGAGPNAFESAVLDAGYRGYVNREQGTAVVLNADVPVAYEGLADGSKMRDRVAERTTQAVATRTEGDELVRKPSNDEMVGIIKARPALATAAPSFKLQFGEARVKASEAAEADRVLADAGAGFQFGEVMRSNRAKESWFIGRDELGRPTFGAGAKAYRVAADLANNVLARVAMKPISKDLSRAMRKMKMEIEQARLLTADAADQLSKLSEADRAMISDVIEGELKRGVKPPQRVLEVAASMQGIMSEQTAELVRLGMLSEDAASRWDGKYLPRFYESKLMDEGKKWVKAAKSLLGRPRTMQGIKGSSLKGRGIFQTVPVAELEQWLAEGWEERDPNFNPDTDDEITIWRDYNRKERESMGEIRDAMFRFVMGYTKSQQDIALGRLYEQLANTVASKHEQEGYVQVPKTNVEDTKARRYGKLAGKWVPQEVMDHLSATDNSMQSDVMKFYLKALSMWKEGKTVLNPVSHANNVLSNLTSAHFAGVSYWDVHKYVGATRDIMTNAGMVQEARDSGLFGGTMTQAELVDMLPDQLKVMAAKTESKAVRAVDGVWNAMAFWLRKPLGKAYEAEDTFFRYLIYRDARQRGLNSDDAVEYAQKYIFTYDDLPKGARMVRNFALPFFSYTYKVVPMLAQTALETPWRYLAPAAAIYTANAIAYAFAAGAGEDDDDWMSIIKRYLTDPDFREKAKGMEEEERKNLPSWMKGASLTLGTSKAVRLGVDEATDLPVFLDVSRMFPGGDLFDAQNNAGGVPLLAPITPNNPLLTAASALLFNKDSFTGKEIVKKTDTSGEAAAKRAEWAWRQFTPAIAVGNYHFDRAMNVLANVTGEPVNLGFKEYTGVGRDGSPVQPGYAAMQTVGIKARPIDLELSAKIDKSQTDAMIRDIDAQIRSLRRLANKGAISDAAMEKETDTLREKRQRLKEGLTVDGEEK